MRSTLWFTVASLVRLAAGQYTVPPPTSAPPDTIQDCTNWYVGADGDTCAGISDDNFITLDQLYRYVRGSLLRDNTQFGAHSTKP